MTILGFLGIFGLIFIIMILGSSVSKANSNDNYPVFNLHAVVSSKSDTADCMVTFKFDSGDDIELSVEKSDFDSLDEGKEGILFFQGTRFIKFE